MIVVADTSVLLNLCCVDQADLLRQLFADVIIPEEVAAEFKRLALEDTRFVGLELPGWVQIRSTPLSHAVLLEVSDLDPGEIAAISLALHERATAILIDERRGHRVALQLGLTAIGVLGILLQARQRGFLPEIRPVLARLEKDAGFWVSEKLAALILKTAGE